MVGDVQNKIQNASRENSFNRPIINSNIEIYLETYSVVRLHDQKYQNGKIQ